MSRGCRPGGQARGERVPQRGIGFVDVYCGAGADWRSSRWMRFKAMGLTPPGACHRLRELSQAKAAVSHLTRRRRAWSGLQPSRGVARSGSTTGQGARWLAQARQEIVRSINQSSMRSQRARPEHARGATRQSLVWVNAPRFPVRLPSWPVFFGVELALASMVVATAE